MNTDDVTIIDPNSSEGAKRELATRLTHILAARDRERRPGERQRWRVVAHAVLPAAAPRGETGHPATGLDYAAWHAHLAGTRRWVSGDGQSV